MEGVATFSLSHQLYEDLSSVVLHGSMDLSLLHKTQLDISSPWAV